MPSKDLYPTKEYATMPDLYPGPTNPYTTIEAFTYAPLITEHRENNSGRKSEGSKQVNAITRFKAGEKQVRA